MKLNFFLSFLSLMLALLLAYWVYDVAEADENSMLCGIGSALCFCSTMFPVFGLHYETARLGTKIRILAVLFFVLFLISHFCFAGFGVKMPYYVIVNGIILIIFLAIMYKLINIKDV